MFMAFAKKGSKRCHHQVLPEPAQLGHPTCLSDDKGILGANICKDLFNGSEPSWESVVELIKALQQQISTFQSGDKHWSACLSQYACFSSFSPTSIHLSHILHKSALQIFSDVFIWLQRLHTQDDLRSSTWKGNFWS
jgi:hypothetical protein